MEALVSDLDAQLMYNKSGQLYLVSAQGVSGERGRAEGDAVGHVPGAAAQKGPFSPPLKLLFSFEVLIFPSVVCERRIR